MKNSPDSLLEMQINGSIIKDCSFGLLSESDFFLQKIFFKFSCTIKK